MRMLTSAAAIAAATALATPAAASTLIINPITAAFSNVQGGSNLVFTGNGTPSATVQWGSPTAKSGYNYTAAPVPINVAIVVDGSSNGFNLGDFTHFNQPIPVGSSITGARLTITYGLVLDGNDLGNRSSVFDLDHWETPNGDPICADGGQNGQGINNNGCADRVKISLNQGLSEGFLFDDVQYFLNVGGFSVGGLPVTQFWTREQADNKAQLLGFITAEGVTPGIPEPATWAMLIAGFGMVGVGLRRRKGIARVEA